MFRRLPATMTPAVYWRWMRAVTATLRPFRCASGKWRGMADRDLGEHRLVLPRVQLGRAGPSERRSLPRNASRRSRWSTESFSAQVNAREKPVRSAHEDGGHIAAGPV